MFARKTNLIPIAPHAGAVHDIALGVHVGNTRTGPAWKETEQCQVEEEAAPASRRAVRIASFQSCPLHGVGLAR